MPPLPLGEVGALSANVWGWRSGRDSGSETPSTITEPVAPRPFWRRPEWAGAGQPGVSGRCPVAGRGQAVSRSAAIEAPNRRTGKLLLVPLDAPQTMGGWALARTRTESVTLCTVICSCPGGHSTQPASLPISLTHPASLPVRHLQKNCLAAPFSAVLT